MKTATAQPDCTVYDFKPESLPPGDERRWKRWMGRVGIAPDGTVYADSRTVGLSPKGGIFVAGSDGRPVVSSGDGILLDVEHLVELAGADVEIVAVLRRMQSHARDVHREEVRG